MSKPKDNKKQQKKGQTVPEEDPVKDMKKFIDSYNKAVDKYNTVQCVGVVKKFKSEIVAYNEGEREQLPNFPIIISEPMDYNGVRALMDAMMDFKWIHQLSFWKVKIGDDGVMAVADFLKADEKLKTLELLDNNFSIRGCGYLGKVLTQNDHLTNLILDHNNIGDEGVIALGEGLKWNSTVVYLSMQYCGIGAVGGEAIAKFVIRSGSVKELFLRGNCIGPSGVTSIAQSLAKNMALQKLDLSDNTFGIDLECLEALRDGIESNESLSYIDVHLNSMVPAGAAMLLEVLQQKPNIIEFKIYERVGETVFKDILETIKTNIKANKKPRKKKSKKKKA